MQRQCQTKLCRDGPTCQSVASARGRRPRRCPEFSLAARAQSFTPSAQKKMIRLRPDRPGAASALVRCVRGQRMLSITSIKPDSGPPNRAWISAKRARRHGAEDGAHADGLLRRRLAPVAVRPTPAPRGRLTRPEPARSSIPTGPAGPPAAHECPRLASGQFVAQVQ